MILQKTVWLDETGFEGMRWKLEERLQFYHVFFTIGWWTSVELNSEKTLLLIHSTIPIIYIGTQQKFTNFIISTLLPLIPMLKSGKLWKKSLSKPTLSSVGRGKECGRRNLWNFCVCSIYFVRDCNWRLMTNFINICAKFIILYNRGQIQTAIKITE